MEYHLHKEPLLYVENLYKSYGDRQVLNNVSFEVYKGEIVGLLGLSGSGKSTLLKIICGFENKNRGNVCLAGSKKKRFFSSENAEIRSLIGFSSQQPSYYPQLTVWENLAYFGTILGLGGTELYGKIEEVLKTLDIYDVKKVDAQSLSEGMKKRLDIACSIIHEPQVLILDEPTANLDYKLRDELLSYIKKINQKNNITILFVSHYLEEIQEISNRVLMLVNHQIHSYKNSPKLKEEFMELVKIQNKI